MKTEVKKQNRKKFNKNSLKYIAILIFILLLSSFVFADGWPAAPPYPPSHATLYADTITSRTDGSPVSIADSQGLYVTGNVGIGISNPSNTLTLRAPWPSFGIQASTPGIGFAITPDSPGGVKIVKLESGSALLTLTSVSGNVGIGTTNPLKKFHIVGDNDGVQFTAASSGSFRSSIINTFNLGPGSANKMTMKVCDGTTTGEKTVMTLNGEGNVGIGTTGPDVFNEGTRRYLTIADSDGATLELYNTLTSGIPDTDLVGGISFIHAGSGNDRIAQIKSSLEPGSTTGVQGNLAFYTRKGGVGPQEHMRIDHEGNVGIGTAGPTSKLHVEGADADGWDLFTISSTHVDTNVRLTGKGTGTGGFQIDSTGGGGYLQFMTGSNNRMRIDSSGNVGIGTTGPGSPLEISNNAASHLKLRRDSDDYWDIQVSADATGDNRLSFQKNGASNNLIIDGDSVGVALTSTGVGIGTNTPDTQLHIRGGAPLIKLTDTNVPGGEKSWRIGTEGGVDIGATFWIERHGTDYPFIIQENGDISIRNFPQPGSDNMCWDGTSPSSKIGDCTASSIRYKENINDLDLGLDEVLQLRPIIFDYKKDYAPNEPRQVGFIAEDVAEITPLLVRYKDGQPNDVEYQKMTVLLAKAIQELAGENQELKARIEALELKNG